jgi:hypothetical protein
MKIENLKKSVHHGKPRISATIVWEDLDREPQEIYFETEPEYTQSIHPNPNAFVMASILPAHYFGERRLYLDEEICPKLKEGLITAQSLLHHWWYPQHHKLVKIEAKAQKSAPQISNHRKAAFCFSGGIDSLATLHCNHHEYPESHPGYLKDGLLVFGLEVRDSEAFKKVLSSISAIAEDANLTFIPVYTNIIELGPENKRELWRNFWLREYMSASFSSIAHAFSRRWENFLINSSHDVSNLIPHGSNPLLTSCYSSWDLVIKEEGISYTRFQKTKSIASWDVALKNLRVCNAAESYRDGTLNCGKCEKCLRTMLSLTALGTLEKATAFPTCQITADKIDELEWISPINRTYYREIIGPLIESGRGDLAVAIKKKLKQCEQPMRKKRWKILSNAFGRADRRYLSGKLGQITRQVFK